MIKSNPDILCPSCLQFDYDMNRKGGVSLDVLVVCNCDWKQPSTAQMLHDEKVCENNEKIKLMQIDGKIHIT